MQTAIYEHSRSEMYQEARDRDYEVSLKDDEVYDQEEENTFKALSTFLLLDTDARVRRLNEYWRDGLDHIVEELIKYVPSDRRKDVMSDN